MLVLIIAALLWSFLVAVTLTPFIGFAFPLAAIDAPSGLFHRSFRLSRGYRLRLAGIAFTADLPWVFASHIPSLLMEPTLGPAPSSLHTGLSTFITLLSAAFGAMVLGRLSPPFQSGSVKGSMAFSIEPRGGVATG